MSLDELIGARLAVGIPGLEATEEVIRHLAAIRAQGLVVFSRNFTSPAQLTTLIQRLEGALGWQLLVMVDHEGGRIDRFPPGTLTHFPDAETAGNTQEPDQIQRQGEVEAEELKRLGIYMNLAPCVDVIVEGCDAVIGDRSYGRDPDRVSAYGVARVLGLQSRGVAACAKHFPGLGAVPRDPHKTLPTVTLDATPILTTHLPPFSAAIEAGVAAIMSSHVCYPGLGELPGVPATFSPRIMRGLLREQLGFQGVTLTDDLKMGAVGECGSIGEAAVRAAQAGHDLLLFCDDLAAQQEARSALREAYRSGRLDTKELEASAERLATLRARLWPS